MTAKATLAQQIALDKVSRSADKLREARRTTESLIREQVREQLQLIELRLKNDIQDAYSIPNADGELMAKSLLMRAYGSSNRQTILDYLSDFTPVVQEQTSVDTETSTVTVNWYDFSTGLRVEGVHTYTMLGNGWPKLNLTDATDPYMVAVNAFYSDGRTDVAAEFVDWVVQVFEEANDG